jgi:hypothetical protein
LLRADETKGGMLNRADADILIRGIPECHIIDVPAPHLIHWLDAPTTLRLTLGFLESLR